MDNADKAGPKIKISGEDNLVYRKGSQEVYLFSEAHEASRLPATEGVEIPAPGGNEVPAGLEEGVPVEGGGPTGDAGDFNKVNYWKEESTGKGNPRTELLLREVVGLLQMIEQRLDRLEKYMTRPWNG